MTWLNPLAWIGLLAVAGPVLAHLLARRRIQKVRFPTLRFLDVTRLTPARRRRITDVGLLAVRIGVVIAAVAALAQPRFPASARADATAERLVRAVILDTSASMSAPAADGVVPLDAARVRAESLVAEAESATLLEDGWPAEAIDGAAAWLATQSGRRELVVVSDFQRGSVTEDDLAGLPESLGLRFVTVETSSPGAGRMTFRLGDLEVTADVALAGETTDVTWQSRILTDEPGDVRLLAGVADAPIAQRVLQAAQRLGHGDRSAGGRIAVVFPSYADRATLLQNARAIDEPWMFDLVDTLRRDAAVESSAQLTTTSDGLDPSPALLPVVRGPEGRALILAGIADVDDGPHVTFFLAEGPTSRIAGAVLASLPAPGGDSVLPITEMVSERVPVDTLRGWERAAESWEAGTEPSSESHGRWFWLVALVLLGFEAWLRRAAGQDETDGREVPRAGVA